MSNKLVLFITPLLLSCFPTSQVKPPPHCSVFHYISPVSCGCPPYTMPKHVTLYFTVFCGYSMFILTPEDLELGTSPGGKPVELVFLGSHTSLNKNLCGRHEKPLFKWLVKVVQMTPKII